MMFERFTDGARQAIVQAQSEARQLGHGFIGCEHLLLGVLAADEPAAAVLREHELTPERARTEVIRLVGAGRASRPVDLLNVLDREALAAIGIDLDVVRSRIEATFGPGALARAVPGRRRRRRGGLRSRLRRPARNARLLPATLRNGELLDVPPVRRGHIPFTPRAKKSLERSLREALALGDTSIGVQHIALAVLGMDNGTVPLILSALGLPAAPLRAAILDRYRQAS
jgi:Clp amino terminal domain, pathogenicity island component